MNHRACLLESCFEFLIKGKKKILDHWKHQKVICNLFLLDSKRTIVILIKVYSFE